MRDHYRMLCADGPMLDVGLAMTITPEDMIPRSEANAMVAAALKEAASVAQNACLVPPDGGNPTEDEENVCRAAANYIRTLIDAPADAALARMLAEAERQMLREALEVCDQRAALLRDQDDLNEWHRGAELCAQDVSAMLVQREQEAARAAEVRESKS